MQCSIDMGRNNVTKKYKYSLGIFYVYYRISGPGPIFNVLYTLYFTILHLYILLVCYNTSYNTVLLYTNNSNFLLISLQI